MALRPRQTGHPQSPNSGIFIITVLPCLLILTHPRTTIQFLVVPNSRLLPIHICGRQIPRCTITSTTCLPCPTPPPSRLRSFVIPRSLKSSQEDTNCRNLQPNRKKTHQMEQAIPIQRPCLILWSNQTTRLTPLFPSRPPAPGTLSRKPSP